MKVEVCENHHLETRPPRLVIDPDDKNTQNCPQTNKYPPKVLINKHWTKNDFQKRNHHQRFFLFSWLRLAPIWKSKTPINWIGAEKFPIPDHFQNLLLLVSHLEISINSVISILNKVLWHPWDLWGLILKNIISVFFTTETKYCKYGQTIDLIGDETVYFKQIFCNFEVKLMKDFLTTEQIKIMGYFVAWLWLYFIWILLWNLDV